MSKNLAMAKEEFYKSGFYKALSPFSDILKNADDPNFWEDPKNKPFVDFVDYHIQRVKRKNNRIMTRKEIMEYNLNSLLSYANYLEQLYRVQELDKCYIDPFRRLISHL